MSLELDLTLKEISVQVGGKLYSVERSLIQGPYSEERRPRRITVLSIYSKKLSNVSAL